MSDDATVFHVWHDGERAAGLGGENAEVKLWLPIQNEEERREHLKFVKETLAKAMADIWDWNVHVMTQEELDAEEAADAEGDDDS